MTKINMWLKLYNQAKAKGLICYTYKGDKQKRKGEIKCQ
jgi:hypothetical protein